MAVSFIPNQPILFEASDFPAQPCLNKDQRAYAPLMQQGDEMCVQVINEGCESTCDTNIGAIPNQLTNGSLTVDFTGWTSVLFDNTPPTPDPGFPHFTISSAGATCDGTQYAGFYQTIASTGGYWLVSFDLDIQSGDVQIGIGDAATLNLNTVVLTTASVKNIDNRFTFFVDTSLGSDFCVFANSAGSIFTIKDIKAVEIAGALGAQYCYDLGDVDTKNWRYVESLNGYQAIPNASANNICSQNFGLAIGQTYIIRYTITDQTNGSLTLTTDTSATIIDTQAQNGSYVVYYTHTPASELLCLEADAMFDGVVVIDVLIACYDQQFRILDLEDNALTKWYDSTDLTHPVTFYQDRIIWCFNLNQLRDPTDEDDISLTSGCYKVQIQDCCGEVLGQYTSTNFINYNVLGWDCSRWVEGSNDGYAFGFFFSDPSTSTQFTLGQRLRILQFNPVYPAVVNEYLYSNGNRTRSYAQSSKQRQAWFDYVDEATHDIIRLQMLCDTLTIDNVNFFCLAEDYEPEWGENGKYNLAQSRVTLQMVTEPTLYNKSC